MRILQRLDKLRPLIRQAKRKGRTIGFVPTLGAFHEGHLCLIRRARKETDLVVVSIFVNPLQFDRPADFRTYPRTLPQDARLASKAGADVLFAPLAQAMYPAGFQTFVEVEDLSRPWEGRFRPGHFRGVTTVVTKLFHLVQPDIAYLGQKDAQQARVVEQLIHDLNFDMSLHILPTVREADGLAMSSRNRNLSSSARRSSRVIFQTLQKARRLIEWGERRGGVISRRMRELIRQVPGARIDYATVVDPTTFKQVNQIRGPVLLLLAVWIGSVRLVDCEWVKNAAFHHEIEDSPGHRHRRKPSVRRLHHH